MLGPKVKFEAVNGDPLPELSFGIEAIQAYVDTQESQFSNIKPDNQSQFIWADKTKKTEYAVLYLHGYTASHGEFHPILNNFSRNFRCNTYMPRLALHGLQDEDAFEKLTPKLLID